MKRAPAYKSKTIAGMLLCALLGLPGCDTGGAAGSVPPAEAYEDPSQFAGVWFGESAGIIGELTIKQLGPLRYYGTFVSDDQTVRFVLNMTQQTALPIGGGTALPANLMTFEWQDGHAEDRCTGGGCGRGRGWALVNSEDTALIGKIGYGSSNSNSGAWSFVRVDDSAE